MCECVCENEQASADESTFVFTHVAVYMFSLSAAARRAGIETLILPTGNREEWENLPASVREHLNIHFVDSFDNVIEKVFDL